jgi:acetyl-CoA C-acetyltransferase
MNAMKKPLRKVMLLGGVMTGPEKTDTGNYRQFAAKPYFQALDQLGLTVDDLGVINVAYNERQIPDGAIGPMMSEVLTGLRKPVIPISAACAGGGMASYNMYHFIASGRFDIGAVVTFSTTSLYFPMDTASAMGNYNDVDYYLGLSHVHYSSLKETLYHQKYTPGDLSAAAAWARQAHWYGRRNPMAVHNKGPLPKEEDLFDEGVVGYRTRSAAGRSQACCLIFASEDVAKDFDSPLTFDIGLSFRAPYMGNHFFYPHPDHREADISNQPGVGIAAREAMAMADVDLKDIDLFQVHDLTPYDGMMQLEALGLAPQGQIAKEIIFGATAVDGAFPTNTDGGSIAFGHSSVGGDFSSRIIENMQQLRGESGERQVKNAEVALAHAYGTHQSLDVVGILQK